MGRRPLARRENLLTEQVGDELLVYDEERDVACRLNRTAALVWEHSDGERTIGELASELANELGELADEELVVIALDRLAENGLLISGHTLRDPQLERLSRRRFMRRSTAVGAAVLALPVVEAVVAPTPAAAISPIHTSTPPLSTPPLSRIPTP